MGDPINLIPAIQLIIALLFWEISKYAVRFFMGRTIGADNVSRADCELHQEKIQVELQTIKGILLAVAMASGIKADQLKGLTK
jgi:hypothetical protein